MYWTVRNILPVIATALLISIVLFTPASADTGEVMLPSGGSHSWPIALDSESLLSYRVEADGGNVDIYLMTSDDYERFKLGEKYTYIADGSFENVPSASAELALMPDTYRLVAIAEAASEGLVMREIRLTFDIDAEARSETDALKTIMVLGVLIIFALVAIIALDLLYLRRKDYRD